MIKSFFEDVSQIYLSNQLRINKLERSIPHTSGNLVKKGKDKKLVYWQYRKDGKQIQVPIKKDHEDEMRKQMGILKNREQKLRELWVFQRILERVLKVGGIQAEVLVQNFNNKQESDQLYERKLQQAKKIAQQKRYSKNYKHQTDKGDLVASKSEEMIANMLFAMDIEYEYEKEMILLGHTVIPDFVIKRKNGKMKIWEHAGLLEMEEYARRFNEKLNIYEKAGFTRQDNLIVTRDVDGSLSAKDIRRIIEVYNLSN